MLNRQEVQELHEILGAVHQAVKDRDGEVDPELAQIDVGRALELAALLVSDIDGTEIDESDERSSGEACTAWGETLLSTVTALTGVERDSAFVDGVAYMLHAEIHRDVTEGEGSIGDEDDIAANLLDAARRMFISDREDGPYSWES